MKIGILNYNVGNLFSIKKILLKNNVTIIEVNKDKDFAKCDKLILPGQGSFDYAMNYINKNELTTKLLEFIRSGKFVLGICLGMQLLLKSSEESQNVEGLNFIEGEVLKFNSNLISPNINWLKIENNKEDSFQFNKLTQKKYYYFAHSYYCSFFKNYKMSYSYYNNFKFTSLIQVDNVIGTQFHPEISGINGKMFISKFIDL